MNGENYDIILIFISDINNHNYDGQNNYSKNHPSPGNSNNHLSENGQAKNLEGEIAYFRNRFTIKEFNDLNDSSDELCRNVCVQYLNHPLQLNLEFHCQSKSTP